MPPWDFDMGCDFSETLLEAGYIARMNPEDPRFRRSLSDPVCVFDSQLRLAS
jgi:hypothetical protein